MELIDAKDQHIQARLKSNNALGAVFVVGLNVAMHVTEKLKYKKVKSKLRKCAMQYSWHPNVKWNQD